jgi:hypothetical protein
VDLSFRLLFDPPAVSIAFGFDPPERGPRAFQVLGASSRLELIKSRRDTWGQFARSPRERRPNPLWLV